MSGSWLLESDNHVSARSACALAAVSQWEYSGGRGLPAPIAACEQFGVRNYQSSQRCDEDLALLERDARHQAWWKVHRPTASQALRVKSSLPCAPSMRVLHTACDPGDIAT